MSTRKTRIEPEIVIKFLKEKFNKDTAHVTLLKGGEMSCPYSFSVNGEDYIIRIDKNIASYKKDEYAWKHFSSSRLPIPDVVKIGKFDPDYFFAITKRAVGKTLDTFSDGEIQQMLPSIITVLDTIHKKDISNKKGYGYWDIYGNAEYTNWKTFITTVNKQNEEWLKHPVSAYEELLNKMHKKIITLSHYCPEERYLVHGDFGFNNVIANGKHITGVLDWGEGLYGDFVYDIAWLDSWQHTISYEASFYQHYKEIKKEIQHFKERIQLYKLFIYYGSLIFFFQSDQRKEAEKLTKDITPLLS